jgi:hypothetical protein
MVVMLHLPCVMVAIVRAVMMVAVVLAIVMVEIQVDVAEQHMLMVRLSHKQMLDIAYRTGDRSLGKHKQQGDAKHRSSPPEPRSDPVFHTFKLAQWALAGKLQPDRPLATPFPSTTFRIVHGAPFSPEIK